MNPFIRALLLMSAMAGLTISANFAYADSFNFSFSGVGVSASGTFTTNPLSGGSYLITSISGTQNGSPMSLLAPGQFTDNDNLLFPSPPFLDGGGVSYLVGGSFISIEFDTGVVPAGYIIEGGPFGCGTVSISFSASPASAVPEPATLLLFGSGIFALGAAWRRKKLK
jgi:PEP-CTERM motif-containing protein